MNYLDHSMRNLGHPSNTYYVFLKEQLISFRLLMLTMGCNDHIETKDQFIASLSRSNDEEQDFLCELYMHNPVMIDYEDWDPNPHIGEVQSRAFMSFMRNHLKWNNATTAVENIEWEDALWVRGSPSVEKLLTTRNQVMQDQAFVSLLETAQLKLFRNAGIGFPFTVWRFFSVYE